MIIREAYGEIYIAVSILEPEGASLKSINRAEEKHASNDSRHTRYISGPYSLSERPPLDPSQRSLRSVSGADDSGPASTLDAGIPEDGKAKAHHSHSHLHRHTPHHQHHSHQIISQVAEWLKQEKAKKATNHSKRDYIKSKLADAITSTPSILKDGQGYLPANRGEHRRTTSGLSDEGVDFEKLELILAGASLSGDGLHTPTDERRRPRYSRHSSLRPRTLKRSSTVASSDTDYLDGDPVIPSADVVLDNSKTLAYSGGAANSEANLLDLSKRARKEKEAWLLFKNEIVRLAHTLRLKGWRKVPLDHGGDIHVERLSGAMTNAVYVVSPPSNMQPSASGSDIDSSRPRKSISPQWVHLIFRRCLLVLSSHIAYYPAGNSF